MLVDFSSGMHYILAMAPEVVLSVAGMVVLIAGVSKRQQRGAGEGMELGWLALGGILIAAVANGWLYFGLTEASPSQMIALDHFRLFANWILLLGGGFSIVVSLAYVDRHRLQAGEYYALILFAVVGMMVMASARDLMLIFIGLELMSVGIYALAGFNRRDRRSAEAGLKYFLLGPSLPVSCSSGSR